VSIDVMTKVIQRAPVAGSKFTCMLVMANWCNDDGESLYPSMDLLAEAMRVSRSQAKRILRSLMPLRPEDEASGNWWFRVVGNENGGAPGMTRRYEMNVARLDAFPKLPEFEKADERRRNKGETGRTHAPRSHGETGCAHAPRDAKVTGRTHAPPRGAPMRPDSSEEPSVERERAMDEFDRALKRWPVPDSPKAARKAWNALSPAERIEAASEIDRYVNAQRSVGRTKFCSFARYLKESMWLGLPERAKLPPISSAPPKPLSNYRSNFLKRYEAQKAAEAKAAEAGDGGFNRG